LSELQSHLSALRSGVRHLFKKRMTLRYPESKMQLPPGYRYPEGGFKGRHILDMQKCAGCSICAYTCKNIAGAIKMVTVEGAFARNRKRIFPQIDYGFCVFCGFCVDTCSFGALNMGQDFELSSYDKKQLIYSPEQLTASAGSSGLARFIVSRNGAHHRE